MREAFSHVGSNLTVPNFHFREFDSTSLRWKLQVFKGSDDHLIVFIFGVVVLEKFMKKLPS